MSGEIRLLADEYGTLLALARDGVLLPGDAGAPDRARELEALARQIERRNGVSRQALWVQWQEADHPVPPRAAFPAVWPPELRALVEVTGRAVLRADVLDVLARRARRPLNVLVTSDAGGIVGWTELEFAFPH